MWNSLKKQAIRQEQTIKQICSRAVSTDRKNLGMTELAAVLLSLEIGAAAART
jgi:hypothetical protein